MSEFEQNQSVVELCVLAGMPVRALRYIVMAGLLYCSHSVA